MTKAFNPLLSGDLRVLIRVSLPIMLFLLCEGITVVCERVFLSYHSLEGVHASVNATYLATFFQSPCAAIAFIAQVFVGLYQGNNQDEQIGPCVWQLIWFSLLSSLIVIPLSLWTSSFYFKGTVIEREGVEYFSILTAGSFFLPLNAALSSFFLGRGKTLLVTSVMLGGYALDIGLSWLFIFGIKDVLPALGMKGAPLAKIFSLACIAIVLMLAFLRRENRERYKTWCCRFSSLALWQYVRTGIVRAVAYLVSKGCWVSITYILVKKGGEYLDVLTVGGTIIIFFLFIPSGLYKAILTIASNLLGGKKEEEIVRLCRSFVIYVGLIALLLALPLLFFPNTLMYLFDISVRHTFERTFGGISLWIWLYLTALTIQVSFCSLLVAARELKAQLGCYLFLWPISFAPVYVGFYLGDWQPSKLWMLMIFENLAYLCVFLVCLQRKKTLFSEVSSF